MSKNTKIFLGIFSVILVALTVGAVVYKNLNKDNDESHIIVETSQQIPELTEEEISNQNRGVTGSMLSDTYYMNGVKYSYDESNENGINVKLVQVSGISNVTVQENINTEIKERVKKILDSNNFKSNSDSNAKVDSEILGNFSDVLSIKITVTFNHSYEKCYGLNYRLDNGERLRFSDLFVYNAPKKNILTSAAYKSFAMGYYTDEGVSNDFYANIEGDVLRFLSDYDNGKLTEFAFSPMCIETYRDGKIVTIDMIDCYEYIALYNEYQSTSDLYSDSAYVAKSVPVFTMRPESVIDLYERNSSNLLDVIIYSDEEITDSDMKAIERFRRDVVKELVSIREEKGLIYTNYIEITHDKDEDDEDVLIFEEREAYIQVGQNEFNDLYDEFIGLERDRANIGYSRSKIYLLDDDNMKTNVSSRMYNVKTGEEIVEEEEDEEEKENEETPDSSASASPSPSSSTTPGTENPELNVEPSSSPESSSTPSPSSSTTPNVSGGEITTRVIF